MLTTAFVALRSADVDGRRDPLVANPIVGSAPPRAKGIVGWESGATRRDARSWRFCESADGSESRPAFVVPGASPLRVGMPPHAAKKPTIVPPGCNAEATAGVLEIYEHTFEKEDQMAAIATERKPAAKTSEIHLVRIPTARIAGVVDRTAKLSDELLKSFETSERAAIEAIGQFTMTIEEALPHEVTRTSEMAKRVTESGLEMTDRLVHTEYDLLRDVVDSAANWLRGHDGAKSITA